MARSVEALAVGAVDRWTTTWLASAAADRRRCCRTRTPRPTPVRRSPRRSTRVESSCVVSCFLSPFGVEAQTTSRGRCVHRLGLIVSPIRLFRTRSLSCRATAQVLSVFQPSVFTAPPLPVLPRLRSSSPLPSPRLPLSSVPSPSPQPLLAFTRFADRGVCGEGRAPERCGTETAVTVSMRRMSAGSGYQYLLRSVAAGDGQRALSTPLTRYYSEVGTPPGRWLGSGVGAFGAGQIRPGMQVTEEQLALLVGMGRDPVTGEQLGRAYPSYKRLADRIEERVAALDPEMTQEDCAAETTRIEAEETAAGMRRRGRRIRPHLQRPEVGLGALGRGRRRHPGADRRRPPRGGRRRDRPLRARGRCHPGRHLRQRRRRGPGRRGRRRGRCLRPLRLARRRSAAPHARRRRQQGPHRHGRPLAQPRRPPGLRLPDRPVGALQRAARGSADARPRHRVGAAAARAPTGTRDGRSPASATT